MMVSARALAAALLAALALGCGLTAPALAASARPVDARLAGAVVMHGRVTTEVRVPDEHRGLLVSRTWTFSGSACGRQSCRRLTLLRQRNTTGSDRVTLRRTGRGRYTGSGRFFVALECRGAVYPHGELAPFTITVTITRAVTVQGIRIASRLSATYTNRRRIDRTICPVGPSHDAAHYSASMHPGVPPVSFTPAMAPNGTASFADHTPPGGDGAPITGRHWNFGDPGSGAANTSSESAPTHTYGAPGSYPVTLTVTDADGLTASQTQTVVAPGPTAAFSPTSSSTTAVQFTDQSSSGAGGSPITAWSWNFGDPSSGATDSSSVQNPEHTFSTPGTYNVCLTVTDAAGRQAQRCAGVTVTSAVHPVS